MLDCLFISGFFITSIWEGNSNFWDYKIKFSWDLNGLKWVSSRVLRGRLNYWYLWFKYVDDIGLEKSNFLVDKLGKDSYYWFMDESSSLQLKKPIESS